MTVSLPRESNTLLDSFGLLLTVSLPRESNTLLDSFVAERRAPERAPITVAAGA